MRSKIMTVGAILVVLTIVATGFTTAAGGATPSRPGFTRLTAEQRSLIEESGFRPRSETQVGRVRAVVQIATEPVAAQRSAGVTRRQARRAVRASQRAVAPAVRQAGARVVGRMTTVVNALVITVDASQLDAVAAIAGVRRVDVSRLVRTQNSNANAYTGAPTTWTDLGVTGTGMDIAIIDDGVDYLHADFGGSGVKADYDANDRTVIEPGSFPTAKVVGGYDFVGDDYDADSDDPALQVPVPDADPLACGEHGTHVAGTAAGMGITADGATYRGPYTAAAVNSTAFRVGPGSAPEARIHAYKVFGCDGSVFSDIVVAAIDRAVRDRVDVINMSLGSDFGTSGEIDGIAVDNATAAGVLVVLAAGNAGPGNYVVGAPSTANTGLSVAAMDASGAAFPGASISGAVALNGQNSNGSDLAVAVTGETVDVGLGCDAADFAGVAGKIAIARRGVCARTDRATLGQAAGAVAVVLINNSPGLPPYEGPIPGVTIPFIGVKGVAGEPGTDGETLRAAAGGTITIGTGPEVTNETFTFLSDFTSNGPRRGDSAQKPEVSAPGVSIVSAAAGFGNLGLALSGTSMATPHTAGLAALVRQAHPTWGPLQVKAALVNTGDPSLIADFDTRGGGSGLVQPRKAADTASYAWTKDGLQTITFGFREIDDDLRKSRKIRITNTSNRTITYDLTAELTTDALGAVITFDPPTLTIRPGKTAKFKVWIELSEEAVAALPGAEVSNPNDPTLVSINGNVVATPRDAGPGIYALRTPFILVPQGVSDLRADGEKLRSDGQTATGDLEVQNKGDHEGSADIYQWAITDPAGDTVDPDEADITDIGVQSLPAEVIDPTLAGDKFVVFAVNQPSGSSTQSIHEIDIAIDSDGDGIVDYTTVGIDGGLLLAGAPDGSFLSLTLDGDGNVVDGWLATAPSNSSAVLLPVLASAIGSTPDQALEFVGAGFSIVEEFPLPGDLTDSGRFNPWQPALNQGDFVTLQPGEEAEFDAIADLAEVTSQAPLGWMVVSFDDEAGRKEADTVKLKIRS